MFAIKECYFHTDEKEKPAKKDLRNTQMPDSFKEKLSSEFSSEKGDEKKKT